MAAPDEPVRFVGVCGPCHQRAVAIGEGTLVWDHEYQSWIDPTAPLRQPSKEAFLAYIHGISDIMPVKRPMLWHECPFCGGLMAPPDPPEGT